MADAVGYYSETPARVIPMGKYRCYISITLILIYSWLVDTINDMWNIYSIAFGCEFNVCKEKKEKNTSTFSKEQKRHSFQGY